MSETPVNWLDPANCNKAKCKTCIFRDDGQQLKLSPARYDEILTYLATFKSSHRCHTTELTCYGALEFQAQIMHGLGLITDPTPATFLQTAKQYLEL
jgi:hypothetical protein